MKRILFSLAITIFTSLMGLLGCAKSEISNSSILVSNQSITNNQNSKISNGSVDTSLQSVASNFQKKLEYYNGDLISLTLIKGNIKAEWNSKKCDWFKEEVIDLAISVNRGYTESVKGIDIERICNSNTRIFSISGKKFDEYKSGQINDIQFTQGIE
ncbi:MAG: hypothetical protein LH614_12915 [Pyrinomonadaceae bacterium]|nr:hypothetical protein [Pyrinomonadaceae bacterium]